MDKSIACDIAQTSLLYLMQNTEEFSRFANITGIDADDIRNQIGDDDFLRGIMEYILNWEPLLISISEEHSIAQNDFRKAHRSLLGSAIEYQST